MIPLHTRQPVETSYRDAPIERYRVPGGWLYHATGSGHPAGVALAFVPDPPVAPREEPNRG